MGCLRLVILLVNRCPPSFFEDKLANGLKVVDIEPQIGIELLQQVTGHGPIVTTITNVTTDDIAILLFNKSLVVLAIRSGAGERQVLVFTVLFEPGVDEQCIIVAVNALQRKWQLLAKAVQDGDNILARAVRLSLALCPAAVDLYSGQRVQIVTGCGLSTVGDQVHLDEARPDLIPIGKSADGDGVFEQLP